MGSWGMDPFDNDDAADWAYALEDGAGPSALQTALAEVVRRPDPDLLAEAPAVAAAALVAAALGVSVALPDAMREWLAAQDLARVGALAHGAVAALDRVLADSDLADTWGEQGDEWREQTQALRDGIAGANR